MDDQRTGPAAAARRARTALRRAAVRFVQADLDAVEQRLVRELQASGRAADDAVAALRAEQRAAAEQLEQRLSARLAALEETLRELGGAMSREHGLAGAAGAYREALYLLHEVRRDLRAHTGPGHGAGPAVPAPTEGPAAGPAGTDPYAGKHPAAFDYAGFERRFRGDPEAVEQLLSQRYLPLLAGASPVVDIGCGRGELLAVLQAAGLDVVGVEPEPTLASEARERGLRVEQTLGADYLRGVGDGSLGAVVSFHVVEHLVVDDLIELLQLAARKLRPGGLFVAETPNPMTFLTLHESYLLDPTHVQPLHPALLSWLAEGAGFRSVEVAYHSPATSLWFPPLQGDGPLVPQLDAVLDRLNHQLYGPQDYSLVARA